MTDIPLLKTANEFSLHIETLAVTRKITYVDAILEFCSEHMLDPAEVASKVNKSLKSKLEHDFRQMNYLKAKQQLEV